jgi:hypothetical protein
MADRFFVVIGVDVINIPDFQAALEKAKRFASVNDKPYAVCEARVIARPDGITEVLEKPRPTGEGDQ